MHCTASNSRRTASRAKGVDDAHQVRKTLTNIEVQLVKEAAKVKEAQDNVKRLRAEQKQVSGGKKVNLKTSGRGFLMPAPVVVPSTSTDKEHKFFLAPGIPSSSLQNFSSSIFNITLAPELELLPSSAGHPGVFEWEQTPLHFPSSTCPPVLSYTPFVMT